MKNYCAECEIENCELRDQVCFCEDCADYYHCDIRYVYCDAMHEVECNNGFEPIDEYGFSDDEVEE